MVYKPTNLHHWGGPSNVSLFRGQLIPTHGGFVTGEVAMAVNVNRQMLPCFSYCTCMADKTRYHQNILACVVLPSIFTIYIYIYIYIYLLYVYIDNPPPLKCILRGEAGHFSYMSTRTLKQHLLYEPFLVKLLKRLPKEVGGSS